MRLPISIIIPTYNEEHFLPKLLNSIKNQVSQPAEIIVSDNSSTDKTRAIARKFNCIVVDGGLPSKARNNGAKVATQPVLLFLDADVVLPTKDFLEKTLAEMKLRKLGITSCFMIPLSKSKLDSFLFEFSNSYYNLTKRFFPQINGFCIFVKKKVHQKINGFDETVLLAEDYEYISRAVKITKFDYLRSCQIGVSSRRLDSEGRLKIGSKYFLAQLYFIFLGPIRTDVFKYKLGDHSNRIKQ